MSLSADVLRSESVNTLCVMFETAYAPKAPGDTSQAASILTALGACAGFAAQMAVWRALVIPSDRNPGDFLVYTTTKSNDLYFFGDAINQFLFSLAPDRLSFLSLAAGGLSDASQIPDLGELLRHVSQTIGSGAFGVPRLPPAFELSEPPRSALTRTWNRTANILKDDRPAEWPVLLGAAARRIIDSHHTSLARPTALRILLEAAVPMSKLNPTTVEGSGIRALPLANWSMRALRPENSQQIVAEVRAAMPVIPAGMNKGPPVIAKPNIAFLNLAGEPYASIVAADRALIGALFHDNVQVTTAPVPICDVLFLYCDFEPSSKIVGQPWYLRGLIRKSTAKIAVIASQVPGELMLDRRFQGSLAKGDNPPVNLILINNRNGDAFGRFYTSLFRMMWSGVPMPMAWVRLAPQTREAQHEDIPGAICLMEAGGILFGTGRPAVGSSRVDLQACKLEYSIVSPK